jgi:hypothetical protein
MSNAQDSVRQGIGGWLILVVIGLVITPIRIGHILLTQNWPIFRDGHWEQLTTVGSPEYHHLWAPLLVFEIVSNLLIIGVGIATLVLLFRKSKRTPAFAIAWLGLMVFFVVADFFLADLIPAVAAQSHPESTAELVRGIIGAAVWIPYFLASKRVKATFIQ